MAEFRISILFQYFMYILAEFNTFSRSWKPISQFNTFPILSIPREDPDIIFPTGFLSNHTLEQVIPLESCQSLRTLYSRLSKGPGNARYGSVLSAPGLRSRSRKESEVFGWSRRFLGRVGGFWVESEVFGKSRRFLGGVGVGHFTSDSATLVDMTLNVRAHIEQHVRSVQGERVRRATPDYLQDSWGGLLSAQEGSIGVVFENYDVENRCLRIKNLEILSACKFNTVL